MAKSGKEIISAYAQNSHYDPKRHGPSHGAWTCMNTRPEFYSGRGARTCDLNAVLLEMIYDGVKIEHGDDAAKSFVRFVADFGKMSATSFLNAFYLFVDRGCVHEQGSSYCEDEIDFGPEGHQREGVGFGIIGSVLSGMASHDETEAIRTPFLLRHAHEMSDSYIMAHFFPCGCVYRVPRSKIISTGAEKQLLDIESGAKLNTVILPSRDCEKCAEDRRVIK